MCDKQAIEDKLWEFWELVYKEHREVDSPADVPYCRVCPKLKELYPHKPERLFKDWRR